MGHPQVQDSQSPSPSAGIPRSVGTDAQTVATDPSTKPMRETGVESHRPKVNAITASVDQAIVRVPVAEPTSAALRW